MTDYRALTDYLVRPSWYTSSELLRDGTRHIPSDELTMGRRIGIGGWYSVFEATLRDTGKVAVKRIAFEQETEQMVSELIAECKTLALLPVHANLVRFYGICQNEVSAVIEYMPRRLLDVVESAEMADMSGVEVMRVIKGIAAGLAELHRVGVIHNDVAVRNVLLTAENVPKIVDFSLAVVLDVNQESYMTESDVGPLRWMAPEAVYEKRHSRASDVWAFGVVLVELYTRTEPYAEISDPVDVARRVCDETLKFPALPSATECVASIARCCNSYEPAQRPTMDDIVNLLKDETDAIDAVLPGFEPS